MIEQVLIDTNVLVTATDATRSGHLAARSLIESDPRAICFTNQNVREFLAAATRPVDANGLGLEASRAVTALREMTSVLQYLIESEQTRDRLVGLVAAREASGKQVHDANLVAVAVEHGVTRIVTDNRRHFERFADLIEIEDLA